MLGFIKKSLTNKQTEKRMYTRFIKRVAAVFHLDDNNATLTGTTKDINLVSLYLTTEEPANIQEGLSGTLSVKSMPHSVDCYVARSDEDGIVLRIANEKTTLKHLLPAKSSVCRNCGKKSSQLQFCPGCHGINTVCNSCLKKDGSCMECRSDELIYSSRIN